MELNNDAIQAIIGSLNLTDDQAAAFQNAEDVNKVASDLVSSIFDEQNQKFLELKLNEPEFKKTFYDEGYTAAQGRYMNSGREAMRSFFGLDKGDVYDDSGKGRDLKEILSKGTEKIKGAGNKDIVEIQEEFLAAKSQWEERESSFKSQLEAEQNRYQSFVSQTKMNGLLKNHLAGIGNLKHSLDDAVLLFPNKLGEFKIGLTEDGNLSFKTEAGKLPVIDNEVVKEPSKYIQHLANTWGWVNEEKEPEPKKPITIGGDPGNGNPNPKPQSRMERIAAKGKYDPTKA